MLLVNNTKRYFMTMTSGCLVIYILYILAAFTCGVLNNPVVISPRHIDRDSVIMRRKPLLQQPSAAPNDIVDYIPVDEDDNQLLNEITPNKSNVQSESDHVRKLHYRSSRTKIKRIERQSPLASRQLPQAIIIGVKKAGTRALLEFIRIHPDVRAPGPETHFFDRNYHKGLEWYRSQMPATLPGQITMEKTPSYFITHGVPARLANMSDSVRLILVVRDPVTRAISDYAQTQSKRPGMPPFDQMAFLDNKTGLVDTSWGAIKIGVYSKHLERWLKHFPLSQFHFVNGERLISDPASELAKLQDFLGIKRIITDKHFYFNSTKGFPCLKKPEGSGNPHCLGKTKGRPHPPVDPAVIQRLRDFYRPFNAKFYKMTGQDFGWP